MQRAATPITTFTLTHLPNGHWRYDDGSTLDEFATDGRPWPEAYAPDTTIVARLTGATLDQTEWLSGRPTGRTRWTLAPDGHSLTGTYERDYPDGTTSTSPSYAVRVGRGIGFAGQWKMLADPPAGTAPPQPASPAPPPARRPHWVISTAADGIVSWFIPATGELLRGRMDGSPDRLLGPQQPAGRTFRWRRVSPLRIEFYCYDLGHLIERATETLSPDGMRMTDRLWAAGHADEPDITVFTRR